MDAPGCGSSTGCQLSSASSSKLRRCRILRSGQTGQPTYLASVGAIRSSATTSFQRHKPDRRNVAETWFDHCRFSFVAPTTPPHSWNSIPLDVWSAPSCRSFKIAVKTVWYWDSSKTCLCYLWHINDWLIDWESGGQYRRKEYRDDDFGKFSRLIQSFSHNVYRNKVWTLMTTTKCNLSYPFTSC